jgi:hypothetical protein
MSVVTEVAADAGSGPWDWASVQGLVAPAEESFVLTAFS